MNQLYPSTQSMSCSMPFFISYERDSHSTTALKLKVTNPTEPTHTLLSTLRCRFQPPLCAPLAPRRVPRLPTPPCPARHTLYFTSTREIPLEPHLPSLEVTLTCDGAFSVLATSARGGRSGKTSTAGEQWTRVEVSRCDAHRVPPGDFCVVPL